MNNLSLDRRQFLATVSGTVFATTLTGLSLPAFAAHDALPQSLYDYLVASGRVESYDAAKRATPKLWNERFPFVPYASSGGDNPRHNHLLLMTLYGDDRLDLKLKKAIVSSGESVHVAYSAGRLAGFESELARMSMNAPGGGSTSVSLGSVTTPGTFAVRFFGTDAGVIRAGFVEALPLDEDKFELHMTLVGQTAEPECTSAAVEAAEEAITVFFRNFTRDRFLRSFEKSWRGWIGANIVSVGTTSISCLALAPAGLGVGMCATGATANSLDLLSTVLRDMVHQMKADKLLVDSLADWLDGALAMGGGGVQMLLPGAHLNKRVIAIDRLLALLDVLSGEIEHEGVRVSVKVAVQHGRKVVMLLGTKRLRPK